jgi:hypothetical protein
MHSSSSSSGDDERFDNQDYVPEDDMSDDSDDYLDKKYFSYDVFADYTYSDMEYDTDDELAPYRHTRSGQNSASAEAAGASVAKQAGTSGGLRNPDQAPNKRRRTGGYLPPKKVKEVIESKRKAPQRPGPPVAPITPVTPVTPVVPARTQPTMPDFQVKEERSSWERQLLTPYVHAILYSLITPVPETLRREQEAELDNFAVQFFPSETKEEDRVRLSALRRHIKRQVVLAAQNACKYPFAVQSTLVLTSIHRHCRCGFQWGRGAQRPQ